MWKAWLEPQPVHFNQLQLRLHNTGTEPFTKFCFLTFAVHQFFTAEQAAVADSRGSRRYPWLEGGANQVRMFFFVKNIFFSYQCYGAGAALFFWGGGGAGDGTAPKGGGSGSTYLLLSQKSGSTNKLKLLKFNNHQTMYHELARTRGPQITSKGSLPPEPWRCTDSRKSGKAIAVTELPQILHYNRQVQYGSGSTTLIFSLNFV